MRTVFPLLIWAASVGFAGEPCRVLTNGSVVAILPAWTEGAAIPTNQQQVQFHFGLPQTPPQQRWLEEEKLPICHTRWESNGIRYTQTVLVTALGEGPLGTGFTSNSVLLVHLEGENTRTEYTEARAAFAVMLDGKARRLELRDHSLIQRVSEEGRRVLVGALDIPAEGIRTKAGLALHFEGNIPPSLKGSMTVKIPLGTLAGEKSIGQLEDLEFDRELRRVIRAWKAQTKASPAHHPPVLFQESRPHAPQQPAE
jgi:hypothetical protein